MQRTGPNFICIGAQKAGTTWLYKQLKSHPDIWMPPQKELHYFDRSDRYSSPSALKVSSLKDRLKDQLWVESAKERIAKIMSSQRPNSVRWWSDYLFADYSDDWYLSLFERPNKQITGELTPAYSMLAKEDVAKMAQLLPNTKIIFLIRNPVLRAWSMLRFATKQGKKIDFDDTEKLIRQTNAKGQAHRSDYLRTMENYSEAFGSDRILVGFYDAISSQPQVLIQEILRFLKIDDSSLPKLNLKTISNPSPKVDMPEAIFEHLKDKYQASVLLLAERYGSYCHDWARLIDERSSLTSNADYAATFTLGKAQIL